MISRILHLSSVIHTGTLLSRCNNFRIVSYKVYDQAPKQISQSHISESKNLQELIVNVDYYKLNQKPLFREFIQKMAIYLNSKQKMTPQVQYHLQKIIFEIRRYSSAELHANWTDIMNYLFLFKKIKDIFKEKYRPEGFQFRAAMVAESIPRIASCTGVNPKAVSLIHYMSTFCGFSQIKLKKNINSYYIQYFSQNSNTKIDIDIDMALISLTASQIAQNKVTVQSHQYQLLQYNIARRWDQYKQKLGLKKIIDYYEPRLFMLPLGSKITLQQFRLKPNQCINSKQNLAKSINLFSNLLKLEYRYHTQDEHPNYIVTKQLNQYFMMMFLVSKNMQIEVQVSQKQRQTISLWKISRSILQSFYKNKLYVSKSDKLSAIIIVEIVSFYTNQSMSKVHKNKVIKKYGLQILEILYFCKQNVLNNLNQQLYTPQSQNVYQFLLQIVRQVVKKLPEHSKQIRIAFNKLYRHKNYMFIDKQWNKLFKSIIKQDTQLQFYQTYFLLGETNKSEYIQMIPFQNLFNSITKMSFIIKEKFKITSMALFIQDQLNTQQELQMNKKRINQINQWQKYLLKLHALAIMCEQHQIINKLNSEFDFQSIFDKWMKPYSNFLLSQLLKTYINKMEGCFKFEQYEHRAKPLPYFERYYLNVFHQNQCYHQYKLIKIILNHQQVLRWLLQIQTSKQINFFSYFQMVILGLGDPDNRHTYMQTYPLQTLLNIQIRKTVIFNSLSMHIFHVIDSPVQLQYMLAVLNKCQSLHQARDYLIEWIDNAQSRKLINKQKGLSLESWKACNQVIVECLIKDIKNKNNYESSNDKRLSFLINYIQSLSQNIKDQNIIKKQTVQQIRRIAYELNLRSDKQTSITIGKMDRLGLLDSQLCEKIRQRLKFNHKQLAYYYLRSHEKQQDPQLVNKVEKNINPYSSIYSNLCIYIKYLKLQNLEQVKQILKTYYQRNKRNSLIQQLRKRLTKLGLDAQKQINQIMDGYTEYNQEINTNIKKHKKQNKLSFEKNKVHKDSNNNTNKSALFKYHIPIDNIFDKQKYKH